ncbi:MAG: HU family DNA-binding protein [Tannerella sp.]|jgi:nucleoid DNA-binding protein|nr:HU family DNA-binding protein [Tannerella sp.]
MDERFSLYNIAEILSEKTGISTQDAEKFLDELIAVINEGIRHDRFVKVRGLGAFKIILMKERESVHVNTGERIVIPEHHKLAFFPEKELKDTVNKPFSMFIPEQLPDRPLSEGSLVTDMRYEGDEHDEDLQMLPEEDTVLLPPPVPENVPQEDADEETSLVTPPPPPALKETVSEEDTVLLPPPAPETVPQEDSDEETSLVIPPPPPQLKETVPEEDTVLLPPPVPETVSQEDADEETSLVTPPPPPPLKETVSEEDTVLLPPPAPENEPQEDADEDTSLVTPPPPPPLKETVPEEDADSEKTSLVISLNAVTSPSPGIESGGEETVVSTPEKEEQAIGDTPEAMPKTGKKVLWPLFVILGLLLLILGGGVWYLLSDNYNRNTIIRGESFVLPGDSDVIRDAQEKAEAAILPDSAAADSTKTSTPPPPAGKENAGKKVNTKQATPITSQSGDASNGNEIIAKVKMTQGQRLTLLSLKYYENKIFWVYIYEYNKSKIGADPNRIPVGMEISIPAKRIYGIDANNEASVRKAQQRQDTIISGLK